PSAVLARVSRPLRGVVLTGVLAVCLAACSDASGESTEGQASATPGSAAGESAGSASFDAALEENPCKLLPKEMVATTFGVPAAEIEEASALSDSCAYEWGADGTILQVSLDVDVFDTAQDAASNFASVTQGMSAQAVADAMTSAVEKMEEAAEPGTEGQMEAAGQLAGGIASGGLQFEDVEGVADEARFGKRFGTLYLRRGNLALDVAAYHGASMTMPEEISGGPIMDAVKAWRQETLTARKQQSVELAKAILASLE
ncbi:MAG: hypothetical protein L0I62_10745, partial [Gammaproteobacteria bacterium]|nr:hypothetical protein [Gammaproteobacteria bacterium]